MQFPVTDSSISSENRGQNVVEVKCKHCGVVFSAPLKLAVCRKCGRDASRPLAWHWRFLAAAIPLWGALHTLILKPHSPVAARHALWSALLGAAIFAAIWLWRF